MRIPLIAANWKMNTTLTEAVALARSMMPELDAIQGVSKVFCLPFISLVAVNEVIKGSSIKLGAQNLYYEDKGAFTGEISPLMLAGLCQFVIIGHSERRHLFCETNEVVNKKVRAAIRAGLTPILCVGERLEENEAGRTEAVVASQLKLSLAGITQADGLVVAYEPVWAIGTGRAATGVEANQTIACIRHTLAGLVGQEKAAGLRTLYGGSVNAANIAEFVRQPEIDGALVGGASLKAIEFISMVRQTAEIKGCH